MTALTEGARVLVTRPQGQSGNLCKLVRAQGGQPVLFPVLAISAIDPQVNDEIIIDTINNCQWVVFVSANAVNYACAGFERQRFPINEKVRVAAVGKATADALKAIDWPVHLVPESGFNSEALLATDALQQIGGQRVVIVKGEGGRGKLANELRHRGARVDCLEVYRRTKPEVDNATLNRALVENKLDVIVLTSGEALHNLLKLAGENSAKTLKSVPLVVISDRIKKIADKLGFNQIRVADEPDDTAIVKTIRALLNGE